MMAKRNIIVDNSNTKNLAVVEDDQVFKFINPNDNNKLSEMSGFDLQDLIILIDEYYIQLRNCLGFEQYITFGLEIECENAMEDRIKKQLSEIFTKGDWITKRDTSLEDGIEIISPVLIDNEITWSNLSKVCSILEPLASIDRMSGGHIHIGTQALGKDKDAWLNFIKMWAVYENIIFRFLYGEYLTARPSLLDYASPMSECFWRDYERLKKNDAGLEDIINEITHDRYRAVNFKNVLSDYCNDFCENNTIEFRCPNGSLDSVIWQNNVNFLVKLLTCSRNNSYNDDIVQLRHQINLDKFANLKWYDEIYLDQALELCDMIFTNNFDKVYFLKQYLKSFQVFKKNKDYPKARTLTKKRN